MELHEKLHRLTRLMKRSALSQAAGLSASTLSNVIDRKANVTTSTAIKLSRALEVDAGWLIDDAKDWPPVRIERQSAVA